MRNKNAASIQVDIPDETYKAIVAQLKARNDVSVDKLKLSDAVRQALANYFHLDAETLQPGYRQRKEKGGA